MVASYEQSPFPLQREWLFLKRRWVWTEMKKSFTVLPFHYQGDTYVCRRCRCKFFEGFVEGILDDDQDLFSKKSLSIAAIFQSNLECKERHISAMKANARPLPIMATILADGGKWNTSTTVRKDHEGNTTGNANLQIEKKTGNDTRCSVNIGGDIKTIRTKKLQLACMFLRSLVGSFDFF
jgi:hypothetical protein